VAFDGLEDVRLLRDHGSKGSRIVQTCTAPKTCGFWIGSNNSIQRKNRIHVIHQFLFWTRRVFSEPSHVGILDDIDIHDTNVLNLSSGQTAAPLVNYGAAICKRQPAAPPC
jgi:hypothetical protein